jgi:hypothetical protein
MKLIRPTRINDAAFTSSSVPETDHAAWSSATTYAKGARVILTSTHRRYESLQASNLNKNPAADPDFWLDVGPTNRWAMLDDRVGTSTTATGAFDLTIAPGEIDALAVVDTDAELINVTMKVGATTIYNKTQSTNVGGVAITDWFLYFFEPLGRKTAITFLDLPVFRLGVVTVTFTGDDPAGTVSVGTLIVGRQLFVGKTEAGPQIGINDFSRKETDQFGVTSVVERAWSKKMTLRMLLDTSAVDGVQRSLAAVRAIPVLWVGEEGYDSLTVYGFYKEFAIDIAYSIKSYCSLTIEGLI